MNRALGSAWSCAGRLCLNKILMPWWSAFQVGIALISHSAPAVCERVARQLQGMLRVGLVNEISYRDSALLQSHPFCVFKIAIILKVFRFIIIFICLF